MVEWPLLAPLKKDSYWVLLEDLKVTVPYKGVIKVFYVPKGFETDFASVPKVLWPIFPPSDREYLVASILHDFLYRINYKDDRKLADTLFFYKMLDSGTPLWKAGVVYGAVRLFGWKAWNDYKRKKEEEE